MGLSTAIAQSFPNRVVTLVVPYPPGGAIDPIGRLYAQKISDSWGVPVIVENRPGAGTTIGLNSVAKAQPDGYTVAVGTGSHTTNAALYKKLPYDTIKDFTYLSLVANLPLMLTVNPELPVSSLSEMVAYAKARPGKLNYSSAGTGTLSHLVGEQFISMTGVDALHVPYKGSAAAVTAAVTGEVNFSFDSVFLQQPLVKAGKLRAIASLGSRRIDSMPELPTVAETYPGLSAEAWVGFIGPAGMPPAVAKKWSDELARISKLPDVRERLRAQGAESMGSTSAEFAKVVKVVKVVKEDIYKWNKVVDKANIPKIE